MTAVATATSVKHYSMFIDGEWVEADDRVTYEIVDPATEEVVATVPRAGRSDAERAVRAAREAFDKGPWPRMTAVERAAVLRKVADKIRERAEELAVLETRQMGKLLADSLFDMNDAAHTFDYYAGLAVEQHGQTLEVPGESLSMVVREPVGVTAGITPWNYPVLMAAWKLAPSLAAGNVMILKPASVSPLTSLELARIFADVGLPKGVVQVITGPGGEVGDYLASSPDVDMVAFTGSVRGRQAHHAPGRREREEGRPRAGRQEPEHRLRRRRLRGRHRRRPDRHLRRQRRSVLGRLSSARAAPDLRPFRRRAGQPRAGHQGRPRPG